MNGCTNCTVGILLLEDNHKQIH